MSDLTSHSLQRKWWEEEEGAEEVGDGNKHIIINIFIKYWMLNIEYQTLNINYFSNIWWEEEEVEEVGDGNEYIGQCDSADNF